MIFKAKFIRDIEKKKMTQSEKKQMVDSFPEPRDDIDRTAFQYSCSYANAEKGKMAILHVLGCCAIPVLLILYWINGLFCKRKEQQKAVLINEQFLTGMSYQDKIPPALYEEFGDICVLNFKKYPDLFCGVLDRKSFGIWFKLFCRHPFCGLRNAACLSHIGSMNRILKEYSPRAVICYMAEKNFASSIVTCLCESKGSEYICFMHGDSLTEVRCAFLRFSRFYLWSEHYRDMFNWGRCDEKQYRYYYPQMYTLDLPDLGHAPEYFLTYYFSGNDESAQAVCDVMKKCNSEGKKCKVRPHPRYTDIPKIKSIFEPAGIYVEDPLSLRLEESVANTECVAALFSTVQNQAYYAGKTMYIDDVSDPEYYMELRSRMALQTSLPHRLMSEL